MRSQEEFSAEVFRRGAQRKSRRRKTRNLALLAAPLVAGGLLWAAFSGSAEKRFNNYQEAAPLSLEAMGETILSTAASPTQKTRENTPTDASREKENQESGQLWLRDSAGEELVYSAEDAADILAVLSQAGPADSVPNAPEAALEPVMLLGITGQEATYRLTATALYRDGILMDLTLDQVDELWAQVEALLPTEGGTGK